MSRQKSQMSVRQIEVGSMQNFVYIIAEEVSREAIVIDSGWETLPITKSISDGGYIVRYAVATHQHFDHTETINQLAAKLNVEVLVHELSPIKSKRRVRDGDSFKLGERSIRVLHTPGHTEDSICIYDGENLFTGDTLFIGSWGRTDLQGGSPEELYRSLHGKIMKLPPETIIYPGHDYGDVRSRSLGEESKTNPALTARSLEEFLAVNS